MSRGAGCIPELCTNTLGYLFILRTYASYLSKAQPL